MAGRGCRGHSDGAEVAALVPETEKTTMRNPLVIAAIIALVGTGVAVVVTMDDDAGESDSAKARTRTVRGERGEKGGRGERGEDADVQALERRVARLELEVRALRTQSLGGRRALAREGGGEGESGVPLGTPAFEEEVQSIIAQEREQERDERRERRSERFAEVREEALGELAQRIDLAPQQRESISTLWSAEGESMMALFESARSGEVPRREVRQQIEGLRAETDAEVQKMLGEDEYAQYLELRPGPGRGGGPAGGGGGGGGGGRGGPPR
jgi:hypothetical protein